MRKSARFVIPMAFIITAFQYAVTAPAKAATNEILPSLSPMLEQVTPGVVNIAVKGSIEVGNNPLLQDPAFRRFFENPMFRRFFGDPDMPPQARQTSSVGSGVIIDAELGHIVTNHHVVENADDILVTLADRRQIPAEVVGRDSASDLALLKVDAANLTQVPLGSAGTLEIGDFVVAIGNPFGLGQTATLGIVSALGRTGLGIETYENFIQTDASINPGNSGGALVDQQGRLVGINTAILSRSGGNIGIGFAIPIDMVQYISQQLAEHGKVTRGRLGIMVQDMTADIAEAMDIDARSGAVVSLVMPGSAAKKAGIEEGDIVTTLEGKPVLGGADLRNRIGLKGPGAEVKLGIIRKGEERVIAATLASRESSEASAAEATAPDSPLSGVTLSDIPKTHPLHGKAEGVLVEDVAPESEAAIAGIRAGDIVTSADQQSVTSPGELRAKARDASNQSLLLHIRRGDGALFVVVG